MAFPVSVSFRDVPASEPVEAAIAREAGRLSRYFDSVIRCRVVVAEAHRRHRACRVSVYVAVPGKELVVNHEHPLKDAEGDVLTAVRDAFRAARRELKHYVRRLRQPVWAALPHMLGSRLI